MCSCTSKLFRLYYIHKALGFRIASLLKTKTARRGMYNRLGVQYNYDLYSLPMPTVALPNHKSARYISGIFSAEVLPELLDLIFIPILFNVIAHAVIRSGHDKESLRTVAGSVVPI